MCTKMSTIIWLVFALSAEASSLASDEVAMGYQSALDNASGSEIGDLSDEEICHPRLECFACLRHCFFHKAAGLSPFPSICLPSDRVYNSYEYFIYETVRQIEDCVNHTQRKPNATSLYRRNYTREYRLWPQFEFPFEFHENKSFSNNTDDYYGGIEWTDYSGLSLGNTLIIVSGGIGVCVMAFIILLTVAKRTRGRFVMEIQLNEAVSGGVTISRIIPEESSSV